MKKSTCLFLLTLAVVILTACNGQTVYNHYEHTSVDGWERNDTLVFITGPMAEGGNYDEVLQLRITEGFPFMNVHLIVEQTVLPLNAIRCDTLVCNLIDEQGHALSKGISQYQFSFPLKAQAMEQGTSLHIAVRHNMKREILPGITDVGIMINKKDY